MLTDSPKVMVIKQMKPMPADEFSSISQKLVGSEHGWQVRMADLLADRLGRTGGRNGAQYVNSLSKGRRKIPATLAALMRSWIQD
jgi:hypothetical protein